MASLPAPVFGAHETYYIAQWHRAPWRRAFTRGRYPASLMQSSVISSAVMNSRMHRVLLDIDVPAYQIASSTPGHSHMYFEPLVTWRQYKRVLRALYRAGIIERAFYQAACGAHAGMLRLPWVRKETA